MALKALLLRKKIDGMKKQSASMLANLETLRTKSKDFEKREAELEAAVNEVTDETSAEDKKTVDDSVEAFDSEKSAHDAEVEKAENDKKALDDEIANTEKELSDIEAAQADKPEAKPAVEPENDPEKEPTPEARKARTNMKKRFRDMDYEQRSAFVAQEPVKAFLENVRSLGRGQAENIEKRSLTGGDLLIPEVILPLVRSETELYSKLIKHVNLKQVHGTSRQTIEGGIPEGIWTEAVASLNELALAFTKVEVDAYKVGGYIFVPNSTLEDSDIDLAGEIFTAIGQGIGYAVDKAIVYGTGTKMPTGFAATATKKNVGGKTDIAMYKAFIEATGALKHSNGELFWTMNSATKAKMVAASLSINAAGAIVAGTQSMMPVIGGAIETEDFVPNDEILGGYGMDYVLAERSGNTLGVSDQAKFIEDETGYKGTARYDGKPVFADAFLCVGLGSTDPTAAIDPAHPFAAVSTQG
jgi:HK97 family phage major capsid protein